MQVDGVEAQISLKQILMYKSGFTSGFSFT